MAALASDVVSNVQGPLDVMGISLGGVVALQIAVRHPGRVRSLAVACSAAFALPGPAIARVEEAEDGGMEAVVPSTLERWFTPAALAEPGHPGVRYARERLLSDRVEDFAAAWRAMSTHDVSGHLGEIDVPLIAIAGGQDASVPVAILEDLAGAVPRGRLAVFRGPHMLQLEQPAALTATLLDHLSWKERA
jgi:3-oxoadipate enol-lactonase